MKLTCINVKHVSGNAESILSEKQITGVVEFVPMPDGSGVLMRPIEYLIEQNEQRRGLSEILALSKLDMQKRTVLTLTKKECVRLLAATNSIFIVERKGWGKTWSHEFKICEVE